MSAPTVSVLIPAWNAAASVARAIGSVLEVHDPELECIVVDDGSTDGTAELVADIAARDARVVLIRLDRNEGVSVARNRGLERVRGDWLTLLDADDRFLPGGLATLTGAALASDARAVIGQQVWWDGERQWVTRRYDNPDIRLPGRKSLVDHPGLLNSISPHAKLLHRATWEGLRFEGRANGDQPWIVRALLRAADGIDILGETVYEWYRPRPGSGASSITTMTRADMQRGVDAIGVATRAVSEVADEARLQLGSRSDSVVAAYVARLIAVDLEAHLEAALARHDPEIGRLFDAIREFVEACPPGHLTASNALTRWILAPVLRRWREVPASGRHAFWRLLDTVAALRPSPIERAGLPLRLAARTPRPGRSTTALVVYNLARLAVRQRRRREGDA